MFANLNGLMGTARWSSLGLRGIDAECDSVIIENMMAILLKNEDSIVWKLLLKTMAESTCINRNRSVDHYQYPQMAGNKLYGRKKFPGFISRIIKVLQTRNIRIINKKVLISIMNTFYPIMEWAISI